MYSFVSVFSILVVFFVCQDFPLIFHGVLGKDERELNSPSFFNTNEIAIVVDYLKKLLLTQGKKGIAKISPKDIGIITPYRKQVGMSTHQPGEPHSHLVFTSTLGYPFTSTDMYELKWRHIEMTQDTCKGGQPRNIAG